MSLINVVVGFDGSTTSKEALKRAFLLFKGKDANITIIHVIEASLLKTFFSNKSSDTIKQEVMFKIAQVVQELNVFKVQTSIIVSAGNPADKIISRAKRLKAKLIIVGTNSKNNLNDKEFGSVSHKVIQKCQIPFLIVKNRCDKEYEDILAFSDLTNISKEGILFAKSIFTDAKFKLVHAYKQLSNFTLSFYNVTQSKDSLQKDVKSNVENSFDKFSQEVDLDDTELIEACYSVNDILLEVAKKQNSDLIVLGSHGFKNARTFLHGSTSTFLMEKVQNDIFVYIK